MEQHNYYNAESARSRIESILSTTPTDQAIQDSSAALHNHMEPLDPLKRDPSYNFKKRINENQEVDKRPFAIKALPSIIGILLSAILTFVSYIVLPGDSGNLSHVQQELAKGNVNIGSWTLSVHSVVAAIVTGQGMTLGLAVAISTPLLTWYYISKVGVPYTFIDSSKSVAGSLRAIRAGAGDFKPYVWVSVIYLISLVFRSSDNVALSSFIRGGEIVQYELVDAYDLANLTDQFYWAVETDDPPNAFSDIVTLEGSQPFHAALGSVSNGFSNAEYKRSVSNILDCDNCEANVTVPADYEVSCQQVTTDKPESDQVGKFVNSSVFGIFGKSPDRTPDGQDIYYRIGAIWYVGVSNGDSFNEAKCTIFAANSTRYEISNQGTVSKDTGNVYSIEIADRHNDAFDWTVELPYNTTLNYKSYSSEAFPIPFQHSGSDYPGFYKSAPLPYYVMGAYSLMLQKYAHGVCNYNDTSNLQKCGHIYDFPFTIDDTYQDISDKIRNITEEYYQNIFLLRFYSIKQVEGIMRYPVTVTNKSPMMWVIVLFNMFSIGILFCAIFVISSVDIPIRLGVLQLSILSYRSRLFEGEQYSSEQQLKEKFIVKVVEHEGIFWLKRQDR
ncbi:hypothetical protein HDV06_001309 [Boothiomyces sp. JEL0866]|nr:hypothetical protein HDV06_001309 [Boothiomyces sp. JEL0866]